MTSPDIGIEFRQVTKRYGDARAPLVVHGIDFTVPRGTLTTLLGPSGCGKTTVLRMIAGLESPSGGRILIDGRDVTGLGAAERPVCMVFQSYALFPHLSVLDNVAYGLTVGGMARGAAHDRARATMASVGLSGYEARMPSELSGGQQQRVAVARALVLEPAVMLFDEPLSNLDARLRRAMREEIRALQQRLGLTVAYVTHDQDEALAVSDQIIVMEAGRIAQAGTPRELYERPRTAFVAGFMGEAMLLDAEAGADGTVRLGPLAVPVAPVSRPGRVRLAVRPEAWRLGPPGRGELAGTVRRSSYLGSVREVTLDTPLGEVFVVVPEEAGPGWPAGSAASLSLAGGGLAVVEGDHPAGSG